MIVIVVAWLLLFAGGFFDVMGTFFGHYTKCQTFDRLTFFTFGVAVGLTFGLGGLPLK
jgi:hypothetical protein